MKKADIIYGKVIKGFAAICLFGAFMAMPVHAAPDIPQGFDSDGEKIFNRFNNTPLSAMTGTDGRRTLNKFYELRQYPGSPPMVPHEVAYSFSGMAANCLACHGRGGYDPSLDAYAPVTPHPDNESCFQCHVPKRTDKLFVETNWQSIAKPAIGRNQQMGGSPPAIPHSLQLREDCIACHAGPAAVAEIRVEHASRGNCRQCHVSVVTTDPMTEFKRNK